MLSKSPEWSWVTENRSNSVIFPHFFGRGLLLRTSNLLPGSTKVGKALNGILPASLFCYLALSAYITHNQFISISDVMPTTLDKLLFFLFFNVNIWTFWKELLCQKAGKLSQKKTVLALIRTVSDPPKSCHFYSHFRQLQHKSPFQQLTLKND